MWIAFTKKDFGTGFVSIVAKDDKGNPTAEGPDGIMSLRFRRYEDACILFDEEEIVATPMGDYAYRGFLTREKVAGVLTEMVLGMAYDNFKDSVPKCDHDMKDVLTEAWWVFSALQPDGPYGMYGDSVGMGLE